MKIGELKIENDNFNDSELKYLDKIRNMNEKIRELETTNKVTYDRMDQLCNAEEDNIAEIQRLKGENEGQNLVNENLETRLIKLEVDLATEIEKIKKYKKHIHDLSQEKKEILFENNSLRKTKLGLENELGRFKTDRQKNDQYCDSLVCESEKLQEENNQLKKENEKLKLEIEKLKKNDTSKQNFEEN